MNGRNRQSRCIGRAKWTPESDAPLAKFTVPERKIDEKGRRITFTISTAARDRDGDIIDQGGWDLAEYRANPVVLWAHEGWSPPVGRAENINVDGGRLVSVARFATRDEYAFADTVFQLYKGGFLNATSVGFVPVEMDLIEGAEPGEVGFRFRRQKLLEYSAVPIPSNPEALVFARGAGIDVAPCEGWIERMLDDQAAGCISDLLNRTYIALKGKLHPVMQDAIASRNAAALRKEEKMPEKDDDRPVMTTGAGGEDGHTHTFRHGDDQTEPHEDDGHMHAISYNDDGEAMIEGAEGHGHDAPASADLGDDTAGMDEDDEEKNGDVDSEEEIEVQTPSNDPTHPNHDQPEGQREVEVEVEKAITDWPQPGMSLPVSLLTSEYRLFPIAEAKALKEDWPEIWAIGEGFEQLSGALIEDDIRAREAWAAKHVDDFDLPGVVSQVRHLVRGSRGIEHMRKVLSLAKEHVMNERDKAAGLSPEEIGAVADRVIERAVMPALEKTLRRFTGRVS